MERKMLRIDECEEEFVEEPDIELDIDDVLVQCVDGVIVQTDGEEVKMLFYYLKTGECSEIDKAVQCKCVAELRVSRSRFLEISEEINKTLNEFEGMNEEIPMFV